MVSRSVEQSLPILKLLSNTRNFRLRTDILKQLKGDQTIFNALKEIVHNYKNGKIQTSKSQSRKLVKYNSLFDKFLCDKTKNCSRKRNKVLVQSGGWLSILIPIAVEIISSLFRR